MITQAHPDCSYRLRLLLRLMGRDLAALAAEAGLSP